MHPNLRNVHNYAWLRFMVQCNYYILCVHYPHTLSCLFLSHILIPQAIDIDINVFVSLHYSPMEKKACHPHVGKSTSQCRRLATQSTNLHSPCFSLSCSHPPILRLLLRGRDKSQGLFEGFRCHNNSQSEVDFVVLKCLLDRMPAFSVVAS